MTLRREILKAMALTGLTATGLSMAPGLLAGQASKARKPLKILFLGGTGFLGPHTVRAAQARGHQVTLFNRGKTNPGLFADLETIQGDRHTDDINQLRDRRWDAVIDTSSYFPRAVSSALSVLADNIDQYLLVSTISVYRDFARPGMDESAPLATLTDPDTEEVTGESYGPLKALCEQAARESLPDRSTIIRPGLIVGPGDKTDRFTWWPVRIKKGGEVLAPGSGDDFIQFIDVRDLGEWMVHCAENRIPGTFNAQSRAGDRTMADLLTGCQAALNPDARLTWVPGSFLARRNVAPWTEMPVWLPPDGDYAGVGQLSSEKAYAHGLGERKMADTIEDTWHWFAGLPADRRDKLRAGIAPDKEQQVLAAWHRQQS